MHEAHMVTLSEYLTDPVRLRKLAIYGLRVGEHVVARELEDSRSIVTASYKVNLHLLSSDVT